MKKKLSDIGEFGLIRMFRKKCPVNSRDILRGIGDDAAAFRLRDKIILASSDLMLEGIHFDLSYTTPFTSWVINCLP
jgi:thiamine-monophosphate kinase